MKPRIWIILAALAAVSACSTLRNRETDPQALARYMDYAGEPVQSFSYLGRFDSWRALGRDKLVVWTGINDAYLLTVQGPCRELPFVNHIGLTTTTHSVQSGFDFITVGQDRCRIMEIRPVNYKEMKAAQRAGA